jgi:hypothetical protein
VFAPTLVRGGFDPSSRSVFVVLAGVAALTAGIVESRTSVDAARHPTAVILVALAVLSVASAAWTVGTTGAAIRDGLVIGGYAAVFVAGATLAGGVGLLPIATGIAGLAVAEALLGLGAVAAHALPDAERLSGTWQPGGTFEYTPALAALEVAAIPCFAYAFQRGSRLVAGAAAAGALLAGGVLGLTGSRLPLVLAAGVILLLIGAPYQGAHARSSAAATGAAVVIGVLTAPLLLGDKVARGTPGAGLSGAAGFAAVSVLVAVGWPLVRRHTQRVRPAWISGSICVVTIALAAVAAATATPYGQARKPGRLHTTRIARHSASAPRKPRIVPHPHRQDHSLLHGRGYEWEAAIDTWLDRPITGAGAGAYYVASLPHQAVARSRFAHNLPLELAAELGVLGLVLGIGLYGSTAWTIARAAHVNARLLLGPVVALFMIVNLVDWPWHLAGLSALWAVASGALVATA